MFPPATFSTSRRNGADPTFLSEGQGHVMSHSGLLAFILSLILIAFTAWIATNGAPDDR